MSSTAAPVRLGLAGRGPWARRYVAEIEALPGMSLAWQAGRAEWRSLLGECDALVVSTAAASHAELVEAGIRAGLPVLCEKPLTMDPAVAERLRALAAEAGTWVLTDHVYLWHPGFTALVEATRGQELVHLSSLSGKHGPFRPDVSVRWDYGPHDVAMAIRMAGSPPSSARLVTTPSGPGETVDIHLEWADPALTADLRCSNVLPERVRRFGVELDWGELAFEDRQLSADPTQRPLARVLLEFCAGVREGRADLEDLDLAVAVVKVLAGG